MAEEQQCCSAELLEERVLRHLIHDSIQNGERPADHHADPFPGVLRLWDLDVSLVQRELRRTRRSGAAGPGARAEGAKGDQRGSDATRRRHRILVIRVPLISRLRPDVAREEPVGAPDQAAQEHQQDQGFGTAQDGPLRGDLPRAAGSVAAGAGAAQAAHASDRNHEDARAHGQGSNLTGCCAQSKGC